MQGGQRRRHARNFEADAIQRERHAEHAVAPHAGAEDAGAKNTTNTAERGARKPAADAEHVPPPVRRAQPVVHLGAVHVAVRVPEGVGADVGFADGKAVVGVGEGATVVYVGAADGGSVGSAVGTAEGTNDGAADGSREGVGVGSADGSAVGTVDGIDEGIDEGTAVGANDGAGVGSVECDGSIVGAGVGGTDG